MTTNEISYITGFFDGEGSILLIHQKRVKSYILKVSIANTDKRVLNFIQNNFGGNICGPYQKKSHHTPWWSYELQGRACIPFIDAIYPYTHIKKEQMDIAKEMINTYTFNPGRGRHLPQEIVTKRQSLKENLHFLKTKGKGLLK